jgi:hypothetical protein
MVTGGFRLRAVMEQAISSGGADMIGLARPMCVLTDTPLRLLQGQEELPRYEAELSLFPPWLSFLNRSKTVRTVGTFGVQHWYYAQLDSLGRTGKTNHAMTPFEATRQVMSHLSEWLSARKR